jgi:hypothetical protein
MNCDGSPDANDINPFMLALLDPAGYMNAYPDCDIWQADLDCDWDIDDLDRIIFDCLVSQQPPPDCIDVDPDACALLAGTSQGPGTDCANVQCRPVGACCVDGQCTGVMIEAQCLESGGSWFEGDDCSTVECPPLLCEQSEYPACLGQCPSATVCVPSAVAAVCRCEPGECGPSPDGTQCDDIPCDDPNDRCIPRCMNFDPATGETEVVECECRTANECVVQAASPGTSDNPCVVADNGTGTVTLPPEGCEYLSPDEVHQIIDGLPPGTTIELDAIHRDFICDDQSSEFCSGPLPPGECEVRGGDLGGHVDCFASTLELTVKGTGDLSNFARTLFVPVSCEVHTGPRNPGDAVQAFDTDMVRLQGELFGDPDFCTFRVEGGTDNGLPSPGHTTLTRLPGGDFNVDSFFDITYTIDFQGCPGSSIEGLSGTTQGTLRMQTGFGASTPACAGGCPAGAVCDESVTVTADGTVDICCDCIPEPLPCQPTAEADRCEDTDCPITGDKCTPTVVRQLVGPAPTFEVLACDCLPDGACHVAFGVGGPAPVWCEGRCPEGFDCALVGTDANGDTVDDTFTCRCEPSEPGVTEVDVFPGTVGHVLLETPGLITPDPDLPPTDGVYRSPSQIHAQYNGTDLQIILRDIRHRPFAFPPPVRTPSGADEIEDFRSALVGTAEVSMQGGEPWTVPVDLRGPVQTIVFGKAGDSTGEWQTEMISMSLSGDATLPDGTVLTLMVRESPDLPSPGQVGVAGSDADGNYAVDSFFDVFTEVSVDGGNGWIPAGAGVRMELVQPVLVPVVGPATANVHFDGPNEGDAEDDDGDGLDEVDTELVSMNLRGHGPTGPVVVRLREDIRSTGQIIEQANLYEGRLDVAPFDDSGIPADSFFDVWTEIQLGAQTLHTASPLSIRTEIRHKPPQDGERYVNPFLVPVELIDAATGLPTGIFVVREVHQPDPTVEHDIFPNTRAVIGLDIPGIGPVSVVLNGSSNVDVFFEGPNEGDADDDDLNGREEVTTHMKSLVLTGNDPATGDIIVTLNANRVTLGQIEESANNQPGVLDLSPFGDPGTTADSFFDVFFEIQVVGQGVTLHNEEPARMEATISNKPPAPGDEYLKIRGPVRLFDEAGNLSGVVMTDALHQPNQPGTIERDYFDPTTALVQLVGGPIGAVPTPFILRGPAEAHVFFEGPNEGDASDNDGNGRDEVATELVSLNLTDGNVTLTLNPLATSSGQIEEQVNNNPGLLDLDPFAPGSADSFFDVLFRIEVGGVVLHNREPLRIQAVIDHKPPIARYFHLIPPGGPVELYDENNEPTGVFIVRARHYTGYTEFDDFNLSWSRVELIHPSGQSEWIELHGDTRAAVFFERDEGEARDDDGDNRDEVDTQLISMNMDGLSELLGPVHVELNPDVPSPGEIEERVNNTPGTLDLPPFTATGSADSFFDVFFTVEFGNFRLVAAQPKHMRARITHKPPRPGEVYEDPDRIPLLTENGEPSGFFFGRTRHVPRPPIEVDEFPFSLGEIELTMPDGSSELVAVNGPATVHVFFEGQSEGTAFDDDGDNRDEVPTEMVALNLTGHSPTLGTIRVELRDDVPSTGQIEEAVDVLSGVLDLPPFGPPNTTADSFFDIFFKITVPGMGWVLHTEQPKRMSSVIRHKPPAPGDWYEGLVELELFDETGAPTGMFISTARHRPRPPVEVDTFDFTNAEIELTSPTGEAEVIEVSGPAVVHVFFEGQSEGTADDNNGNDLDEVVTEMVQLDLRGVSAAFGPVIVTLNPNIPSTGGIEEKANNTPGILDVPPFGALGKSADSFFDIFFNVSLPELGLTLHTRDPKRMRGQITHKPPARPDFYEGLEPVQLYDENGNPSGYTLSATRHRPRPPVEVDRMPFSIGEFQLSFPDGSSEVVSVAGATTVHVFFEGQQEGDASDDNGNALEEVRTRMVDLDLHGLSETLGPIHVGLNPGIPSVGQIEEKANSTPGTLDVPPFTAGGSADSFFDIFFKVQVGDLVLVTVDPKRMRGQISHKPPGPLDWYEGPQTIPLFYENGDPSGYAIGATRHRPRPPVEIDSMPFSLGTMELRLPDGTVESVDVSGETVVHVFFEGQTEGSANDDGSAPGLDEVQTEMVQLSLNGVHPNLGPIHVGLNPNIPSLGEIEEKVNNTPGTLDVPPFAATGAASSFFDIFFRIEVGGRTFLTVDPKRMRGQITHKPPASIDFYEGVEDIELYDENGNPTGYFLVATRHRPRPPVEIDRMPFSIGALEIEFPDGTSETVQVTGDTTVHVFFEGQNEGDADDDDGNGLEEVVTEMVALDLHGVSPLFGPVSVGLNPDIPSFGQIEEKENATDWTLDLPPFTAGGSADSFFDIFFKVEVGDRVFYTIAPKRMRGQITHKPPGPMDWYEGVLDVDLVDEDGFPTGFRLVATRHRPRPPVEVDRFGFSIGELELLAPDGTTHLAEVSGFTEVHVFFEGQGEGSAGDDDSNGREEVVAEMVVLDLHGDIPGLGPVRVTLNEDLPSFGEIEETANATPGLLDIPPFAPTGTADSFFDIFFTVEVGGRTFHTVEPKRMSSRITHKPPAPGDWYEGRVEIPLLNEFGFPTGYVLGFTRHQPTTTQACCLEDGLCRDMLAADCREAGGAPKGAGTACEGDNDQNGVDDACEFDDPCEDCGPDPHWVDQCPGGIDHMPSSALVGIDLDLDCAPDRSFRLSGPVSVRRSNPRDDSIVFPGTRALDGHLDVIDTEIVSMSLTRSGVTLTAGAGLGQGGVLAPSYGVIAEQPGDITLADSFFDVFFEVDLGSSLFAYNFEPLRVNAKIDCLPPDTRYIHPQGCIPLFSAPPTTPGLVVHVANLVTADHSTFPARVIRANPQDEHSLWRSEHNIARIYFDDDITLPGAGDVLIREMLPGGVFGPDLSNLFTFTLENDGGGRPRILRIWENGSTLVHRHWYSVANTGAWAGVFPFELQYVVQVGDASDDARVLAFDVSVINTGIPTFASPDDARRDIDGDLRILGFDVSVTNGSIPSFGVPKPVGHP